MNSIGKTGMNDGRDTGSVWRVYLPSGIDRNIYIDNCYLTGTITVTNENGEIINGVKIGKMAIQLIDFPLNEDEQGSEVMCIKAPYSGKLYVTDVYFTNQQYQHQRENQYVFNKSNGEGGTASIVVDGNGNITISVNGDKDNGNINIVSTNSDRAANLKITVNGNVVLENDGETLIKSNKIQLNESDEPILLGTKTVQLISDILDQLAQESAGPYPLIGSATYTEFKNRLDELKSILSFVK